MGIDFPAGGENFFPALSLLDRFCDHPASYPIGTGGGGREVPSPRVKRPEIEADRSPPSGA
jgi:hypothetical protein